MSETRRLRLAVIGQGRSGRDIHGAYYLSERNRHFDVAYVVDRDPAMRADAEKRYPGAVVLGDYRDLFGRGDIDLVVNASYSDEHFPVARALLEHGFHVLTEKPFAGSYRECETLIGIARSRGLVLAPFHNTQPAPYYLDARQTIASGVLGQIKQISIRFNGFARRWDWQTLQKKMGGSAYNTGPHPICMGLGFLDFDPQTKVVYAKLDRCATSGDAEDYVKILLEAPSRPLIDIEIHSTDAFSDYNLKLIGTRGCMKSTITAYTKKYYLDSENPPRPVIESSLRGADGLPVYCSEKLNVHEEHGSYRGSAFDVGTAAIYESVYAAITEGKPLLVPAEQAAMTVSVIEAAHALNPLSVEYL